MWNQYYNKHTLLSEQCSGSIIAGLVAIGSASFSAPVSFPRFPLVFQCFLRFRRVAWRAVQSPSWSPRWIGRWSCRHLPLWRSVHPTCWPLDHGLLFHKNKNPGIININKIAHYFNSQASKKPNQNKNKYNAFMHGLDLFSSNKNLQYMWSLQ